MPPIPHGITAWYACQLVKDKYRKCWRAPFRRSTFATLRAPFRPGARSLGGDAVDEMSYNANRQFVFAGEPLSDEGPVDLSRAFVAILR